MHVVSLTIGTCQFQVSNPPAKKIPSYSVFDLSSSKQLRKCQDDESSLCSKCRENLMIPHQQLLLGTACQLIKIEFFFFRLLTVKTNLSN